MSPEQDVIIVGGGIIGTSLALTLARAAFKVTLIEALPAPTFQPATDSDKAIALAYSSRTIFESLHVWQELAQHACPIAAIQVSDRGHFGSVYLCAEQENLPALGYVLPAILLNQALHDALLTQSNITVLKPATFASYQRHGDLLHVRIIEKNIARPLVGKVLVACDGHSSAIRTYLHASTSTHDYNQTAIICTVALKRPHQNIAYERFTAQGPLAMLPLSEQRSAAIWTVDPATAKKLLCLPLPQLKDALQHHFGYQLGRFMACSRPLAINLQMMTTSQPIFPGVVLLGNAAHTLHPVAGQGLNLGLRDLAVLAEEFSKARKKQQALGDLATLRSYWDRRKQDQAHTICSTHTLVSLFSNNYLPAIVARNSGMVLIDRCRSLKKAFTKKALGLAGKVPRLACGMSLE